MTNINLFDALEICLQALDQGADVESCLVRFPELAEELRPILVAAVRARSLSAPTVPVAVVRRGKARLLQTAAEMREQKKAPLVVPTLPFWRRKGFFSARFTRLAFSSMAMIVFLLTGGTGLVNASTGALPGDHLYPVKRSWEGVRLIFVFDKHAKAELENEFDNERVHEIEELYTENRIAEVNFVGVIQEQKDKSWVIDGLNIRIDEKTRFTGEILPGSVVQVMGETDDGHIKAHSISLLATPGVTPSAFPSATPTYTEMPETGGTTINDGNGSGDDTESWSTSTSQPTQNWDDSSEGNGTSTPRPGGGDDGSENDGGNHENSTPTPTGEHHDGGDDEHQPTRTPGPNPTEDHPATRTPRPTEGH